MQPQLPFESRVLINPYYSARKDFIPVPGLLRVDESGLLTLTKTTDNQIMLQKPVKELQSVQFGAPEIVRKLGNNTILIYVGLNEAYQVTFATANANVNGGLNIYQDLLQGNIAQATADFNKTGGSKQALSSPQSNGSSIQEMVHNRETFLVIAQQAGVYTPYHRSLRGVLSAITIVAIMIVVIVLYFIFHHA